MSTHANGTFEVKLEPQAPGDKARQANLNRMSIDKQFQGDLKASSAGEMLAARTGIEGSAAYVALEQVSGSLHGRTGTFILHHDASMSRGTPELSIKVVPDSGTGQLLGLTGRMQINIVEGKHSYEFEYTLAEAAQGSI